MRNMMELIPLRPYKGYTFTVAQLDYNNKWFFVIYDLNGEPADHVTDSDLDNCCKEFDTKAIAAEMAKRVIGNYLDD